MQIIVKNYAHYNRALGCYIKSKDEYDRKMKEGGFVSYDEGNEQVKKFHENRSKNNKKLSNKALEIVKYAKDSSDSEGNVRLGSRAIKAMKDIGAIPKDNSWIKKLPKAYQPKGGFR